MFTEVGDHEALNVGGLRQGIKSVQVVKLKFTGDFPEAVIREGADELTLRAEEVGVRRTFIDTAKRADRRRGPPLADAHWRALCQATYQGIEGQTWETTYFFSKELHQAVGNKKPGENQKRQQLCGP